MPTCTATSFRASSLQGTGASQLGVAVATARNVEIILRGEHVVAPIGAARSAAAIRDALASLER